MRVDTSHSEAQQFLNSSSIVSYSGKKSLGNLSVRVTASESMNARSSGTSGQLSL